MFNIDTSLFCFKCGTFIFIEQLIFAITKLLSMLNINCSIKFVCNVEAMIQVRLVILTLKELDFKLLHLVNKVYFQLVFT